MKKAMAIVLVIMFSLATMAACGGKENGPDGPVSDDGAAAPAAVEVEEASEDPGSGLQDQWNGTWFGVQTTNSGTGKYDADFDDGDYFMIIDVDKDGKGQLTVLYDDGDWFAKADVEAFDYGVDLVSGEYQYVSDTMNPVDWLFRLSPNSDNKYSITVDFTDDEGDTLNFSMFFKPWGAEWDPDEGIVPPGLDWYMDMIQKGEGPPYGPGAPGSLGASGSGSGASVNPGSSGGGAGLTGPTAEHNYRDSFYISYPTDSFELDDSSSFIQYIRAKDESVQIAWTVYNSNSDYDEINSVLDSIKGDPEYSSENLTVAGFSARRTACIDFWGDYLTYVFVDFGGSSDNLGVIFEITSPRDFDTVWSPVIRAILDTVRIT